MPNATSQHPACAALPTRRSLPLPTRLICAWVGALVAISLSLLNPTLASTASPWIFLSTLLIVGMPHGAVDAVLLVGPGQSPLRRALFPLLYVSVAAMGVWLWSLSGPLCLTAFLLLSAFHWGTSDFNPRTRPHWLALGWSKGLAVISALLVFHWDASLATLELAAPALSAPGLYPLAWSVFTIATLVHITLALTDRALQPSVLIDFAIGLFLIALCPPLLGVSLYYTLFHALRYYAWVAPQRQKSIIRWSHGLTCLGVIAAAIWLYSFDTFSSASTFCDWAVGAHIRLLSWLTLPHAAFVLLHQFKRLSSLSPVSL